MPRRAGVALATTAAVLWLIAGTALVGTILLERLSLNDSGCFIAPLGAEGEAHWQNWPPGSYCTYQGTDFREPPGYRVPLLIAEIVLGIGLLLVWRRYRDAPDPDWSE